MGAASRYCHSLPGPLVPSLHRPATAAPFLCRPGCAFAHICPVDRGLACRSARAIIANGFRSPWCARVKTVQVPFHTGLQDPFGSVEIQAPNGCVPRLVRLGRHWARSNACLAVHSARRSNLSAGTQRSSLHNNVNAVPAGRFRTPVRFRTGTPYTAVTGTGDSCSCTCSVVRMWRRGLPSACTRPGTVKVG